MSSNLYRTGIHRITQAQWDAIAAEYAKGDKTAVKAVHATGHRLVEGAELIVQGIENRLSFSEFQQAYRREIETTKEAVRDYTLARRARERERAAKASAGADLFCMFGRSVPAMLAAAKRVGRSTYFVQLN